MFSNKKKPSSSSSSAGTSSNTNIDDFKIKELRLLFKKYDRDSDGKLSAFELRAMINHHGQKPTDKEFSNMMREVDKDRDGFISLDEFIKVNTKEVGSNEALKTFRAAFSGYDMNPSGLMSAERVQKALRRAGEECSLEDCKNMMKVVDADGDGMITLGEYARMLDMMKLIKK